MTQSKLLLDYDQALPIKFRETGIEQRNTITIHHVKYTDLNEQRVAAYWVTPASSGLHAAVLYVHPSPGNKDNFLDEAVMLAQRGATSLLIDAPWSQQAWGQQLAQPQGAYDTFIPTLKNLRRAIDVMTAQPNVDANRLGYVGHSFGALCGGVLAGIEQRIKVYALLAGAASFADVAVLNMPEIKGKPLEQEYWRVLAPLDPIAFVGQATPAALLFQFGERDKFPRASMTSFAEAGSAPKKVIWYDVDHYAVNEAGRNDRIEWLQEQLGFH